MQKNQIRVIPFLNSDRSQSVLSLCVMKCVGEKERGKPAKTSDSLEIGNRSYHGMMEIKLI